MSLVLVVVDDDVGRKRGQRGWHGVIGDESRRRVSSDRQETVEIRPVGRLSVWRGVKRTRFVVRQVR